MRRLLLAAALVAAASFGAAAPSASACTGDPCDGICLWWNDNHPAPKVLPYDCPLR